MNPSSLAGVFPLLQIRKSLQCLEIWDPSEAFWPPLLWWADVQKIPREAAWAALQEVLLAFNETDPKGWRPHSASFLLLCRGCCYSCYFNSQNVWTCVSGEEHRSVRPITASWSLSPRTDRARSSSHHFHLTRWLLSQVETLTSSVSKTETWMLQKVL